MTDGGALYSAHGVGSPAPWREEAAARSPSALSSTATDLADASWIAETVDDEEERLRRETQATIRKMSIKERIRQQRSLEALKQLEELRKRAVAAIDREASERASASTGTTRIKAAVGRGAVAACVGEPSSQLAQWRLASATAGSGGARWPDGGSAGASLCV